MSAGEGRFASWRCPGCSAVAVNSMVVREALGVEAFNELWQSLRVGAESGVCCPECSQSMNMTRVGGVKLEGCPVCTLIWFDAGEWETALKDAGGVEDPTRPLTEEEMRRALATWRKERAENWWNAASQEDGTPDRLAARTDPTRELLRIWTLG